MKDIVNYTLTFALAVLLVSCADETPTTALNHPSPLEQNSADVTFSKAQANPNRVLGSGSRFSLKADATGHAGKRHGSTELTGPLFGLSTAPNGDILVADAGAGIVFFKSRAHAGDISLPGITDAAPIGRGSVWASRGLTGEPGDDTGQALYHVSQGRSRLVADLFDFEATFNPDGHELIDSNPFDVESLGGGAALVADAGGNDLLRVDREGNVEVVAIFPDEVVSTANLKDLIGCPNPSDLCDLPPQIPAQAVPTSIAVGPDGYYYVGELKGFPAPSGESNVWKIAPDASGAECGSSPDCVKLFDGGFTSIIDLAIGPDGRLYVAELDEQSWFAVEVFGGGSGGTINACDVGTLACEEVSVGIPILTAIALNRDGTLWATENALIPGLATVVKVP